MDEYGKRPININYYTDNHNETSLIIATVVVILVVVLYLMFANKSKSRKCEYFKSGSGSPSSVWSGNVGSGLDAVVTPMKRKTIPENDAPLSMTVMRRHVEHETGKIY
jgi:hypothetical protein